MKHDTFTTYLDWEVSTVVGIDNPDEWKPGDPDRYFVRGIASFPPQNPNGFTYRSTAPMVVSSDHFTDGRFAARYHGEMTAKLRTMIDALLVG